jgi:hypothetical protein
MVGWCRSSEPACSLLVIRLERLDHGTGVEVLGSARRTHRPDGLAIGVDDRRGPPEAARDEVGSHSNPIGIDFGLLKYAKRLAMSE